MSCAALLAAVSLVGACSSTPEPTPSSTTPVVTTPAPSTSAPSPTVTTPSPSATGIPAAAKVKSEAGAIAFVKYYVDSVNRAWTTPDPAVLKALGDPGCISCTSLTKTAEQLKNDGQRYVSNPASISDVVAVKGAAAGRQLVKAKFVQHKVSVINSSGGVVLTDPQKQGTLRIELAWTGGGWKVWDSVVDF